MASARALALRTLQRWDSSKGATYAEHLIEQESERYSLEPRDRGHLTSIVYGCLRNRSLLDYWLAHLLSKKAPGKLKPDVRRLQQCALYELLIQNAAPHAAVSEAVKLAPRSFRALTNAILRRADRERAELADLALGAPLSIRYSHPGFLVDEWVARFGRTSAESLLAWNNEQPQLFQRTNRLHPANPPGDIEFKRVDRPNPEALASGLVYAQDPSTALAPCLLAPTSGERVLDACASPGGKTALLAEIMENTGEIIATDVSARRVERLTSNLDRLNVTNSRVIEHDWAHSSCPQLGEFDAILVDVPCSNTGVFRRRVDARWRISNQSIIELNSLQLAITNHVITHLKPGGRLVYSTCSIEPAENSKMVEQILAQNPCLRLSATRESVPHLNAMDGAFAARLES